ncbi:52 kDa repressor of the inhibitor of the protein kinase-like [Macrosteles quadrilineatus]|uniref:52 kDa repressor of the inhibitor of the protein kinase-like n=1 Tax=Macrosteles quadrilineatus TaxID=74068 RepID=UPI0023E210F7|nr:52 kDa repressor of the inhibitor of the protein kinase-like [Macrosteles quadrilineatus]
MGPKKKLSGCQFKNIRKEKQKEDKKLASALGGWLLNENKEMGKKDTPSQIQEEVKEEDIKNNEGEEEECSMIPLSEEGDDDDNRSYITPTIPMDVDTNLATLEEDCGPQLEPFTKNERLRAAVEEEEGCSCTPTNEGKEIEIIYDDPKQWPENFRSDAVRCKLVERGPQTVDLKSFKFPCTDDGRHFSRNWFFKTIRNGETVQRQWLLYSQSKDTLFCFPCLLFKDDKSAFSDVEKGFNDWKHLNPTLHNHEISASHLQAYGDWKELATRLQTGRTIDAENQKCIKAEAEKWRSVLKCIVDVILHCARNNLPLRGGSDSINDKNCGVFLSTLELISHYNPQLNEHIANVKSGKYVPSYFSPKIQNEVIEILGKKVRSEILQDIKNAKYFSIMFDCTPDTARLEQTSQIIRYVKIVDGECVIEESFVDFIISHQKTGRGLSEEILDKLMNDGLDIQNCRGQGFDNGANMAGKYEGVQAHICQLNDLAKFIPCSAHSLNLVGVHAAEVSVLMMNFFGKVLEFFNFFSSSTIRWEALLDCVKTTLKRHCETRWSSRRQAVTALQKNLPSVFKVLQNMADRSNNWNSDTTCGATNLLRQIDFEFVCLLEIWTDVLISLDCTNKSLQGKTVTLDVASSLLSGLAKQIQHLREQGVQKYIDNAKLICTSMSIDSSFAEKRLRRVKKMSGEMAEDEAHLISSEKIFERECYSVFDKLMSEMDNRSHIYHNISSDFSFLSGKSLSRNSVCDLQKCAADLGVKYSRDIDTFELVNEVAAFKFQAKELVKDLEKASHLDLLKAISKYELKDAYPNVEISLRIFLTMPVSVASCERSFSKLKIIKNYLRSSMCETRLTNLAILSIEYDRASKIDFNEVINKFALVKARKVQLL